jgi:hypothetical protein
MLRESGLLRCIVFAPSLDVETGLIWVIDNSRLPNSLRPQRKSNFYN